MGYVTNHRWKRWKRNRIWGATATFLCCICFILFTPPIPRSLNHHRFADVRNLVGNHSLLVSSTELCLSFVLIALLTIVVLVSIHRSTQHIERDDKFPFFNCGCFGFCFRPWWNFLQHKVFIRSCYYLLVVNCNS